MILKRGGEGFVLEMKKRIFEKNREMKLRKIEEKLGLKVRIGKKGRKMWKIRVGKKKRRNMRWKLEDELKEMKLSEKIGMEGKIKWIKKRNEMIERIIKIKKEFLRRWGKIIEVGKVMMVGMKEIERIRKERKKKIEVEIGDLSKEVERWKIGEKDEIVGKRMYIIMMRWWRRKNRRIEMIEGEEEFMVGEDGKEDELRRDGKKLLIELENKKERKLEKKGKLLKKKVVLKKIKEGREGEIMWIMRNDLIEKIGIEK